jgi:hypothetical protein
MIAVRRMLLVVAHSPRTPEALAGAARVTGLAAADVSRRLTGILPRVLLAFASPEQAEATAEALEALGFVAFSCDPAAAPGDGDRVLARAIDFRGDALSFFDGQGHEHACPATALSVIHRGVRLTATNETVRSTERRFDLGKAILTGGLMMTSSAERNDLRTRETREGVLLLERNDGEPDIAVYERRLDYGCLGLDKLPSSYGNLEATLGRLRAVAPHAALEDRAARPGFVTGLPLTAADPLDLAMFLISLARTRGC